MRNAALIAVFALAPLQGYSAPSLAGIRVLNVEKSDFGLSNPLKRLVVRVEQTDTRVNIWQLTSDSQGLHVTKRAYDLASRSDPLNDIARSANGDLVLRMRSAPGMRTGERRHRLQTGNLIITRVISAVSGRERQRLVLEPTASVPD